MFGIGDMFKGISSKDFDLSNPTDKTKEMVESGLTFQFFYDYLGVVVESSETNEEKPVFQVVFSVPKKSSIVIDDKTMEGEVLAKEFKKSFLEIIFGFDAEDFPDGSYESYLDKYVKFFYKVRDEEWSEERGNEILKKRTEDFKEGIEKIKEYKSI